MSRDDAEDMAGPDDAGFTFVKWVRAATPEETTAFEAKEAEAAAAKAAKETAAAAVKAAKVANKAALQAMLEGLVSSDGYGSDMVATAGTVVGRDEEGMYTRTITNVTLTTGDQALQVDDMGADDYRTSIYAPLPVIEKIWAASQAERKTTVEQATDYLSKYSGCYGASYFRFVLRQNSGK